MLKLISNPSEDELFQYSKIMQQTLGYPSLEKEDWLSLEGRENVRLIAKSNKIIGGIIVWYTGQYFSHKEIKTQRLRALGVLPEYRGLGIGKQLLNSTLEESIEKNCILSFLVSANDNFYKKCGYEKSGYYCTESYPIANLPNYSKELDIRPYEEKDFYQIKNIYKESAILNNGFFNRNDTHWNLIFNKYQSTYAYVVEHNYKIEAYLIFRHKFNTSGFYDLVIHDFQSINYASTKRVISFLKDHSSVARNIEGNLSSNESFLYLLNQQGLTQLHKIQWMLKVIDINRSLVEKKYPKSLKTSIAIKFINPNNLNENKLINLEIDKESAHISSSLKEDVIIDLNCFSSLYSGYINPSQLKKSDKIWGDDKYIEILSDIFISEKPKVSDIF